MTFAVNNNRERLSMPGGKAAKVPEAPAKVQEAPAATPARNGGGNDHARNIREFMMLDGRVIAVHRHSVCFVVQMKDDPSASIVSLKGGKSAVPIKATYADFLRWWLTGK